MENFKGKLTRYYIFALNTIDPLLNNTEGKAYLNTLRLEIHDKKGSHEFGSYNRINHTITVHQGLIQEDSMKEELINVLIHEALHAYAYKVYKCFTHKGQWKRLADLVSNKTPYKITRLVDRATSQNATQLDSFQSKYVVICDGCGTAIRRSRQCTITDYAQTDCSSEAYRCIKCKCTKFTLTQNY